MTTFIPTRAAALARLAEFLPNAGSHYANERNSDLGPTQRDNVSLLSPAVRHRLITEDEIVRAVLGSHSFQAAEKFIQEVCWRTYWKGWLELRPKVWRDYQSQLEDLIGKISEGSGLDRPFRKRYQAAVDGHTGIACFDAWTQELRSTGYLHNHTRMWFASIWIFTLNLPWQLGADFFHRHLLDGDPASNTLSWRWVAGLQTQGKHYLARAENIQQYTAERWSPKGQLKEDASPLPADAIPAAGKLGELPLPNARKRTALWLHEDDLCAESWPQLDGLDVVAIAGDVSPASRSWLPVSDSVIAYTEAALADGLSRAGAHYRQPAQRVLTADRQRWLAEHGIEQVVTAHASVGPAAGALGLLTRDLRARGISLVQLRRAWDTAFWPHAERGFFQLREQIRPVLAELRIS